MTGRLLRCATDATIPVPDVVGNVVDERTPGVVQLEVDGRSCPLDALEAGPGALMLVGLSAIVDVGRASRRMPCMRARLIHR